MRSPILLLLSSCLLLASLTVACGSPDPWVQEDPKVAARYFLSAVHNQNQDGIWRMLTPDTQQKLEERARSINTNTKEQAVRPQDLVSGIGFVAPYLVSDIDMTPPAPAAIDGTRVQLTIKTETGDNLPLEMVRVEGSWRVIMGGTRTRSEREGQ